MTVMPAAAMAISGAAAATSLSCSSAVFGSSGGQQLGGLRSSASLTGSWSVAVIASRPSERDVKSKALAAFVSVGAAFRLHGTPKGDPASRRSAIALDLNSIVDNVKKLARNVEGKDGQSEVVELAKRAATNAARDVASGDPDSNTRRVLNSAKELVGNVSNLDGNEEAKDAAIDIAKHAEQESDNGTVTVSNNTSIASDNTSTCSSNTSNSSDNTGSNNIASNLVEMAKTLSGKIPDKEVQNAAVNMAKGAAQGAASNAASNAARGLADNAKNKILDKIKGNDKSHHPE